MEVEVVGPPAVQKLSEVDDEPQEIAQRISQVEVELREVLALP